MNIYLDIDGVLLANERNLAPFADGFIQSILNRYPDSTYWLTTHCWRGENRTVKVLSPYLKPETLPLLEKIKPTEWLDEKTDAIDFSQPFLWFDDDLFPQERNVMLMQNALNSWIEVDLTKNPTILKDLALKYFS